MRKISFLIILLLTMSVLCGCTKTKSIEISNEYILLSLSNSGSTITQSVRFGIDNQKMKRVSSSLKEELEFRKSLQSKIDILRNEMLVSLALTYIENPVKEYRINKGVLLTNVEYDEKNSCAGFDVIFTSTASWQYYHKSENQAQTQDGLFLTKQKSEGVFPFSAQMKDGETLVGERYRNLFLDAAKGFSFEDEIKSEYNPQFIYIYSTPYQQLKSNANLSYRGSDGHYHHIWVENSLKADDKISLSILQIHYGWWIFFALFIPLFVMSACIVIIKFPKRKNQ